MDLYIIRHAWAADRDDKRWPDDGQRPLTEEGKTRFAKVAASLVKRGMKLQVVGTSPSAGPLPGSPMGILVVQANGATVIKFYNPGVLEGDGQWRKL